MSVRSSIEWTDATCSRCRRALPPSAFPRDRSRPRGFGFECRECRNERARARYVRRGPAARRGWVVPARDGDKRQARRRVNYLVEQGLLPRPDDLPCLDCADEVFTRRYRHEYDHARGYGVAHQLDVEPVCAKCHRAREEARRG